MSPVTTYLSRLIGLYCILVALSMLVRKDGMIEVVTGLFRDTPLLFMVGITALVIGLAIVLGHNVWSGGAAPVIVTLVGWLALLKSLPFLFLSPQEAAGFFLGGLHYEQLYYVYVAPSLLIGIYLTYAGFTRRRAT